jgi:hypothetical protein
VNETEIVNRAALAALADVVPQTYGEATSVWGASVIDCCPHEWDNRTTWENAVWLLRKLAGGPTKSGTPVE